MKVFNSKVATLMGAAVILTLGGGVGAYAGNLIDSRDIENGSIRSVDLADDSVKRTDINDGAVTEDQIAANSISTSELDAESQEVVETVDELIDSAAPGTPLPGSLIQSWHTGMASDEVVNLPGSYNAMVYLDVQTTLAKPVRVSIEDKLFCVAEPVETASGFEGHCQASRLMNMGPVWVTAPDDDGVNVEVNVVRVD